MIYRARRAPQQALLSCVRRLIMIVSDSPYTADSAGGPSALHPEEHNVRSQSNHDVAARRLSRRDVRQQTCAASGDARWQSPRAAAELAAVCHSHSALARRFTAGTL